MSAPAVKMACVANIWVKQMVFEKAGDRNEGHSHAHDHPTVIAVGKFRVTVDDVATVFEAPHIVFVQAGRRHFFEALTDGAQAYCVHGIRTGERVEDLLDPSMVPAGINPMTLAKRL